LKFDSSYAILDVYRIDGFILFVPVKPFTS
jgi:hypothetical protein